MFKFLKEKLKNFFKKSSKEIIKEAEEKEKVAEIVEEPKKEEKKEEAKKEKKEIENKKQIKPEKPKEEKKGFFARIKERFVFKIDEEIFEKIWNELEVILLGNNMALEVVEKIKENLKMEILGKEVKKENAENFLKEQLKKAILDLLIEPFDLVEKIKAAEKPYVIVFFGINGSGKTTTIAKIARFLQQQNLSIVFSASDTFRAASIEQLEKHASKLNVKIVKHSYGADAAAVAYDAISYAKTHNIDIVLVDTAGRMHTQSNLMREMEKICRVTKPNLRLFIGESIVGNDMIEQAKRFSDAVGIDAIILTKADVDEKGGAAISVSYVTKKPIIFLGTGQDYNDLEKFNKEKIIGEMGL